MVILWEAICQFGRIFCQWLAGTGEDATLYGGTQQGWGVVGKTVLIVQNVSFAHVRNVALFVQTMLQRHIDPDTQLILCDQIDQASYDDGSTVFVIGEGFARHHRRAGCFYVYLNFSIVEVLGNPLKLSREGWSAIRRKKRMMREKIDLYDLVLDYLAPQTALLARKLPQPVLTFPVGIADRPKADQLPLEDRPYDVCFVGALTPRRIDILDALAARGWRLSPHREVVFEDIAARSKCCLNIHAFRSNHLETPRIIGSFSASCPIFTENSFGLQSLAPNGTYVSAKRSNLVDQVSHFLNRPTELAALHSRATRWYRDVYLPSCSAQWEVLVKQVNAARQTTPTNAQRTALRARMSVLGKIGSP